MNAQGDRIAQRRAEISLIQSLVVESMPAFMDTTEEAGLQFMFVDTGRHAHIGGMKRRGEGMGREIQSTTLEVISHRDQDQSAKLQLSAWS